MCSVRLFCEGIKVVLLDIEGTTTPISFVKDTLFGFVRKNLKNYIETNFESQLVQDDICALRKQLAEGVGSGDYINIAETGDQETVVGAVVANVLQLMDVDSKCSALKQLQGHMWTSAYESGLIRGQVFDDVVPALQRLTAAGILVYIYSSGSVGAQKLLFGHSTHGNLLQYLSGHFDTNVGAKVEKESYSKIAHQLQLEPHQILFLTDITAEANSATGAGLHTCLVSRPGNAPLTDDHKETFRIITSFNELFEADTNTKH